MSARLYAFALAAGFGLVQTPAAQAYSPAHIDRLAVTLERQVADLHREVHMHFRLTPSYRHLDEDVAGMQRLARHIHEVAHHTGAIAHLRRDVEEFDRLFHHVQDLVRSMAVTGRLDFRTIAHFRVNLAAISRTLHHLRDDLADVYHGHGHSAHYGGGYYTGDYIPVVPAGYGPVGGIGVRIPLGDRGGIALRIPIR